ncbi:MAG TPA: 50S ribosomal protein L23 [Candidatus Paceibacterota bacterium]|jgi:large subunit ribosomal protein L23|nr:50S ribosomal protein L23 [Parcubacteria group bacterium]MDP6119403.1 50S ribosomal protein L23 [Candidatus Paceibacterota bacterium]HJN62715.1 50S ribosomal protein L23 [Candidatus Paceibacterota bacterium]|tara:strand:+ start:158 stop:595 length:438 start_codon:yes stop_codon:yes gene_type:complete
MSFLGFGKKKKEEKKVEETTPVKDVPKTTPEAKTKKPVPKKQVSEKTSIVSSSADLSGVIIRPRITEKSTILAEEGNVYTFDVHPNATKKEVEKAVVNNYKVQPLKVNVSDIKRKTVMTRGKKGKKAGGKKAMVYLKDGDKIEFV